MSILTCPGGGGRTRGVSSGDVDPDPWRRQAACLDVDPELFFPIGSGPQALAEVEEAKAVCQGCPVLETCREWALATREPHGVWGGMSEGDRVAELRLRARQSRQASRRQLTTSDVPAAAVVAA